MSSLGNEVVSMFEEAGMSPEEISADLGYDVVSVKAALMQFSKVYRGLLKDESKEPASEGVAKYIHEGEIEEMLGVVKEIARTSESDFCRLKAACRIIDEKEGRLDPVKEVRSAGLGLIQFNQILLANRRAKEKVLDSQKHSQDKLTMVV